MQRARAWCFTDFSLSAGVWTLVSKDAKYLVYGNELCTTTNRRHYQGYVYFNVKKTFDQVQFMHPTAHWEIARNNTASIAYCKKDGDIYEMGDPPRQGKRTDFDDVYELVVDGATYREVLESNPKLGITCVQGIKQAISAQVKHRTSTASPIVRWYWGETGTGKSRAAFAEAGDDAYVFCKTGKFWEGYTGQLNVVFDDFRPDQMPFAILLSILDRYRVTVEVKGGSCPLAATNFWITSPKNPTMTYTALNHNTGQTWTTENINQLNRRCTEIKQFGDPPNWPIFNLLEDLDDAMPDPVRVMNRFRIYNVDDDTEEDNDGQL